MPRKKKAKEPIPLADALSQMPIAEQIEPVEVGGGETVDASKNQYEEETAEIPPPPTEIVPHPQRESIRKPKSWRETVRSWTSHGDTGVKHITTTSPDMVGISFPKAAPRTDDEKRQMEAINLKFFAEPQAWLKPNRHAAFDETQALANQFAADRRGRAGEEMNR